ncbi:MAG: PAS domain S-box protein [Candidatus Limnocylindrales bacterium]
MGEVAAGPAPGQDIQMDVLEASPNAVIAVDADATIVYANPQAVRTFGYSRDELLGQSIEMLLPERVAERHVAHRSAFLEHPRARPMGIGLDLAGRRKDGTEFPVEISLSPVQAPDGLRVFATLVDITNRKLAEVRLADSERRFRAVLEASPNAMIAIDEHGLMIYANPQVEVTFGYGRDEVIGEPVEMLLPDRVSARHVTHRNGFMAQPVARPMGIGLDLSGRRRDGTEFPVEISLSPVESAEGRQVFATVVDITARKAAEGQLLQAQKLESIGRLAGGIAHDFNNMLFAIRGYSEILIEDLGAASDGFDAADAATKVAAIADAADRATALTSQLLAFSRQQVVTPRVVDVPEAIRALLPMLRPLIGENIGLDLRTATDTGTIRLDPSQFDQILVNLAVNARDAMPDGGTITIATGNADFDEPYEVKGFDVTAGRYAFLAVTDTGEGMDRETRDRVFEPFFTTKEQGRGTGLGLATIYGIVRQAGGHVWVYSEVGRGSTFKLYFPRVDELATVAAVPTRGRSRGSGLILLVEDDPSVRAMTQHLLERAGFQVRPVEDGAAALAAIGATTEPFAAVVTDVVMPKMSGIELAERVHELLPTTALVLLSGYTPETLDLERAMANGAAFIPKPVSGRQLVEAIRDAMERYASG